MPLVVNPNQTLTYIGNCEFEESSDYTLNIDEFGMDTLVRSFDGRKDKLAVFLRSFRINTPDPEFSQLTLVARQCLVGRAFARVQLTFVGLFDDVLPPPIVEGGWRHQELQLQKEDSNETVILEYKAPVSTYRYITRRQPTRQRYEGRLAATELGFRIVGRRGSKGKFKLVNGPTPLALPGTLAQEEDKNVFAIDRDVICSAFTFRQAGRYWEVTEENEGRLMESEREDLPRKLTFGGFK